MVEKPEKQTKYKNLSRGKWKPGESGNPKGRPKKEYTLTSLIKQYLFEVPDIQIGGKQNEKTWQQLIAQAWLIGAYKGNATLFKELLERLEGKVAQPLTGGEGEALMPRAMQLFLADGTEIKPPHNGKVEVQAGGNGHDKA